MTETPAQLREQANRLRIQSRATYDDAQYAEGRAYQQEIAVANRLQNQALKLLKHARELEKTHAEA